MKKMLYLTLFTVVSINFGALFADDQAVDSDSGQVVAQVTSVESAQQVLSAAVIPTTGTNSLSENVTVVEQELSQEIAGANTLLDNASVIAQELSQQAVAYFNAAMQYVNSAQAYFSQLYASQQ
jgi:hypothetical protein